MSNRNHNLNRWQGYYIEDCACKFCLYHISKKHGCALAVCCCEDDKRDARDHGRIKRKRGSMRWDM